MNMTQVELWEITATGLRFSTVATPKVVISRGTQERTTEESSFMRRTIEQSKQTMALVQVTLEEFDLDEDLKVTYAMFNEVDDPSCIIACNLEGDDCAIDEDETLAEYIERVLDDRMCGLPINKELVDSDCHAYGPEKFIK